MEFVRAIPVRDESGADLLMYEFEEQRFLRKVRRFALCTGEGVEQSGKSFKIAATGEKLVPHDVTVAP